MPSVAMSSSRPDERADVRRADLGRKQRLRRREDQRDVHADALARQRLARACTPSRVNGTLTTTCSSIVARSRPSAIMPSASVATTSALTGPCTSWQIFLMISRGSPPLLRHQRRIGRDAVDDAERHERFDVLEVAAYR